MNLYILVREDLDPSYRMVQGMHAVAGLTSRIGLNEETPFVCLLTKDMNALLKWESNISRSEIPAYIWAEPDLNDEVTAIACHTESKKIFKNLHLA